MNSAEVNGLVRVAPKVACGWASVDIIFSLREFRPIALESEYFFGGRQWRLRLNPADRLRAVVGEAVDAADTSPDHVAGAQVIAFAVRDSVYAPADNEVGLFKRVIVRIDLRARRILNQEQRLVRGAERAIDKHLDGDAGGGIEPFHLRRPTGAWQLRFVEMADGRAHIGHGRFAGEKSIQAIFNRPGLRRLHLKPSGRTGAGVLPGVRRTGWDQSEVAGTKH